MATRKRKKTRPGVVPVIDQENPKTTKKPAQNRGRGRESSNGSSWSVLVEHRPEWIRESGHRYTSARHRCYLVQTSSSSISSLESWRQFLPPRDSCVRSCRGQEIENRATVIGAKEVEYQMLFFVMSGVRSRSTECGLAVRVNRRFTWNCYLSTAASCIQQIESSSDGDERSKVKLLWPVGTPGEYRKRAGARQGAAEVNPASAREIAWQRRQKAGRGTILRDQTTGTENKSTRSRQPLHHSPPRPPTTSAFRNRRQQRVDLVAGGPQIPPPRRMIDQSERE